MNKIFIAIISLAILRSCSGACSGLSPLLASSFSITDTTTKIQPTTAAALTGLTYCTFLNSVTSCCMSGAISTLSTDVSTLTSSLTTKAGDRDKFLVKAKLAVTTASNLALIKDLVTAMSSATSKASGASATAITNLASYITALTTNYDSYQDEFTNFQKARATCIAKIINFYADVRCMACNTMTASDYTTNGADLTLDSTLQTALSAACSPYVTASAVQNSVLIPYYISAQDDAIKTLTTDLKAIAAAASGSSALTTALSTFVTNYNTVLSNIHTLATTSGNQLLSSAPNSCTSTSCPIVWTTWAPNAAINQAQLILGGTTNSLGSSDEEEEEEARRLLKKRSLAWVPSNSETSGVTATFPENPGNVDPTQTNSSAWRQGGLFGCFVALVLMMFI